MLALALVVLVQCLSLVTAGTGRYAEFADVAAHSGPFDWAKIPLSSQLRLGKLHTDALVQGVHDGVSVVHVREKSAENNHGGWDLSQVDGTVNDFGNYDTKTSYTMMKDTGYFSLDHPDVGAKSVHRLSNEDVVHCSAIDSHLSGITAGSFLIGSSAGLWSSAAHVQDYLSSGETHAHEYNNEDALEPLFLYRRVLKVAPADVTSASSVSPVPCKKVTTEAIRPFEAFDSVRIESIGDHPFSISAREADLATAKHKEEEEKNRERQRRLKGTGLVSTSPVEPCADGPIWGYAADYDCSLQPCYYATGKDYELKLSYQISCMEYSYSASAYNFNYNPSTQKAVTEYELGSGLSCSNCYAYVGAGFHTIISWYKNIYRFSAKVSGDAGANAELTLTSGTSRSGSQSYTLMAESTTWGKFPIGSTGLFLKYKLGGLSAEVAGSGSFTGTGKAGAGIKVSAEAESAYTVGGWKSTISWNVDSLTLPYLTFSDDFGAATASASVSVTLTGVQNFAVTYSGWITGYFDVKMSKTFELERTISTGSSSILKANVTPQRRSLQGSSIPRAAYVPGDIITIIYDYTDYNPNEKTSMFLSVVPESGVERNIMMHEFITTATGHGSTVVQWTVPWCLDFRGEQVDNTFINIRTSDNILLAKSTPHFTLNAFTEKDFIISAPADAESVPTDTAYEVKWDPSGLHYYAQQATMSYHGKQKLMQDVVFDLFAESISPTDTTDITTSIHRLTEIVYKNSGSAVITFPSELAQLGQRFYLMVRGLDHDDVSGWSGGYFVFNTVTATPSENAQARRMSSSKPLLAPSAKVNMFRLMLESLDADVTDAAPVSALAVAGRVKAKRERVLSSRSAEKIRARELGSCASTDLQISNARTMGGRLSSVGINLGIGGEQNVGGQSTWGETTTSDDPKCLSFTPAPTAAPNESLDAGKVSASTIGIISGSGLAVLGLGIALYYMKFKKKGDPGAGAATRIDNEEAGNDETDHQHGGTKAKIAKLNANAGAGNGSGGHIELNAIPPKKPPHKHGHDSGEKKSSSKEDVAYKSVGNLASKFGGTKKAGTSPSAPVPGSGAKYKNVETAHDEQNDADEGNLHGKSWLHSDPKKKGKSPTKADTDKRTPLPARPPPPPPGK